jgi:tetratricopeptide (TPR) repeat protein
MSKSIADCNEALQIDPNLPDGYYYRGLAYEALDKTDEATADFTKVIALDKNETLVQASQQEIIKLSSPVPQTTR